MLFLRVSVCVCVREREREREMKSANSVSGSWPMRWRLGEALATLYAVRGTQAKIPVLFESTALREEALLGYYSTGPYSCLYGGETHA